MIDICWKEGFLNISNSSALEEFEGFEIIFGENDFPFFRYGVETIFDFTLPYNFYIEYNIKIYAINKINHKLELFLSKQFDCTNETLLFELHPKNQEETDVWVAYLEKFSKRKKFNPVCTSKDFQINSNLVKKVDNVDDVDYYSKYKICWDNNYFINPKGWSDLNSFELINGCLFKI